MLIALLLTGVADVQAVDRAVPIGDSLVEMEPYAHNGMINARLGTGGARGSAALVHPRVLLTAAHVVFDEDTLTWVTDVTFDLKRNVNYQNSGRRTVYIVTGSKVWTEYSKVVKTSGSNGGIWPFNLDFAAGYRAGDSSFPSTYAAYVVKEDELVSPLRDEVQKLIVGYPLDSDKVPTANQGLMHHLGPKNLKFFDHLESYGGKVDSEGFPYAVYRVDDVEVHGGNSGGPIYVREEADGQWLQAGVITGGSASGQPYTILRGIDEEAHKLIVQAIKASGLETIYRPEAVSVKEEPGAINITWEDNSPSDDGWQIFRHDGLGWALLAEIAGASTVPATGEMLTFVDDRLNPGQVYRYKVRALATDGGVSPWSTEQVADAIGANVSLGDALGAPRLTWLTGGDAAWVADGNGARSGFIRSSSRSWIETRVMGPGQLTFDWSASTETPDPPRIYDNLMFEIDGEMVRQIYGVNSARGLSFQVGKGVHVFRWTYSKDAYSTGGEDLGRLANVRFSSNDPDQKIDGAYEVKDGWLYAHWFGYFFASGGGDWIWHEAFGAGGGWVYVTGTRDNLWLHPTNSNELGWLYTNPDAFPYLWSSATGNWIAWAGMENWFYDMVEARFFQL